MKEWKPRAYLDLLYPLVNGNHPIFGGPGLEQKLRLCVLNITRLITQEISMIKDGRSAREAYEHQSIFMRDAFVD